ncbi:toll/interleukin-1 receptor domain-containing protein [Cytobacillus dafuensis]|uniref:Putative cyclic ADP-D-ribose synthase TIR2 n=1 Tax=Cytobacillus dafuensis TaxID=1742359 RepID=THSB2_CYTDA|nr:toll/interleukin-1 receptor domain-containing protein [Cytobacillus dafuensis]A0A5B8Z260.1 RecName: Full=Putative cyclic ADP-D-ribose synthase TIR2; Short=Putative cADPR synthase TIR2; AltName: Full=Thoeris protein TIR2 [Cytobacillus dafuensis]QED46887.1 toll/interleukin-1 receptor domain-containing protein [Cytobacillus dafuensis]
MPGVAKRKYVGETMRINKNLSQVLRRLSDVLPYNYNAETLLELFQQLYPHEWRELNQRFDQYKEKDEFLLKKGKKIRYKPNPPKEHFFKLPIVKNILSKGRIAKHNANFDELAYQERFAKFKAKRENAIRSRNEKIAKANELIQNVEPLFIDTFIAAYHKRGISFDEKMEIFKELQKYKSKKTAEFFYKLSESERNNQIRNMAFKHLQVTGNYVKLRKNFNGKKKEYMTESSEFFMTPLDLLKRIESNNVQNKKVYDVFISHSYKDSSVIKKIIKAFNKLSISIYCDWTSDSDFLKRELVSEYTKVVLKKRIEQSKNIVFVKTDNSLESHWVRFELDYSRELGKTLFCINLSDEAEGECNVLQFDVKNETISWTTGLVK